MEFKSEELLQKSRLILMAGRKNYRDCKLEVGKLLHEYILQHLREGTTFTSDQRVKRKFTREWAIKRASEVLRVKDHWILEMIRAAMAVEILGAGNSGMISFECLRRLGWLLQRKRGTVNVAAGRNKPESRPISDLEEWEIKPGIDNELARKVYGQAVSEGWILKRVHVEVKLLLKTATKHNFRSKGSERRDRSNDLSYHQKIQAAMLASPGDVADMCIELIETCCDPEVAAIRLSELLRNYLERPRRKKLLSA